MKLVVSLHDVTPFHLKRLVRAEALCRDLGVRKLTYLLVPRYHGGFACAEDGDFVAWCRAAREFAVSWHLHGYQHLEDAATGPAGAWSVGLKRRMLTAGEGEFQALDMASQRRRLEAVARHFPDRANALQFLEPARHRNTGEAFGVAG